jgi:peptidoglycan/xylan/chitin deacetylase (PgdA/CDA1 family)
VNRRQFTRTLGLGTLALALGRLTPSAERSAPQVAITIDDFGWADAPKLTAFERNLSMLAALREQSNLKAAVFVAGKRVDNEKGQQLLRAWDEAGHIIANHSYSHLYYHSPKVSFETYAEDIVHGEARVRNFKNFTKLYRFPFLKEGESADKRDKVRDFLKQRGYRIGHVTIDASDWYVDDRLVKRLKADPQADLKPYRDFYLAHIRERAAYYEGLAQKVLGRSIKHTLLIHYNLLNALFLGDLLRMFKRQGWKLVDAAEAFRDPVYTSAPNIVPAGESLIWALAKESGKFEGQLRYPGEDGEYEKEKMDQLGL